jgi:hypothetical protein
MIGNFNTLDVQVPQEIVHYWGWFLAFGVALLLIGAVANGYYCLDAVFRLVACAGLRN